MQFCSLRTIAGSSLLLLVIVLALKNDCVNASLRLHNRVHAKGEAYEEKMMIRGSSKRTRRQIKKKCKKEKKKKSGSPSPSPTPPSVTSNQLLLCKLDARRFHIPPSDPKFDDPDPEVARPIMKEFDIESEEVSSNPTALQIKALSIGVTDVLRETVDILTPEDGPGGTTAKTKQVQATFKKLGNALKLAGPAISIAITTLDMFGVFSSGPSETEIILDAMQQGFSQMNDRFNDVQRQIAEGITELKVKISNTVLDRIAGRLQATQMAYEDYLNSSRTDVESQYEVEFRSACNEPHFQPENIFFDIYGYACGNCSFGPRKKDNIQLDFEQDAMYSVPKFFANFVNFIMSSLTKSIFLFSVCLPPEKGMCIDRESDPVWNLKLDRMNNALNDVIDNFNATITRLYEGFWGNIDTDQFTDRPHWSGDNLEIAKGIRDELERNSDDYYIQVIVYDHPGDIPVGGSDKVDRELIGEQGRGGDVAAAVWFDNIGADDKKKNIHIRYRSKRLEQDKKDVMTFPIGITGVPCFDCEQYNFTQRLLDRTPGDCRDQCRVANTFWIWTDVSDPGVVAEKGPADADEGFLIVNAEFNPSSSANSVNFLYLERQWDGEDGNPGNFGVFY